MYKVIALFKRRPGLSPEAFQECWLRRRGPLVAACPEVRRCVQSHPLLQGYRKGELLFDGIEETWFDSPEACEAFHRGRGASAVADHEASFLDRSRTVVMPVDVHVIKDGPIPADGVKNIEFVNRRPGMALEPFRRYWLDVHGPIASRIAVIRRYEQNHLQLGAYARGSEPPYDGLAITWFDSTADMKAGATTPEYAITRADEPHFLPDGHLPIIITRERVVAGG